MSNGTVQHHEPNEWAIGFAGFAGVMIVLIGIFHAIAGIAGIWTDQYFVVTDNYVFKLSTMTWGWIHLAIGIIMVFAGFYIFTGAVWARTIGVILAVISGIANFLWLPYSPMWSILIIAIDVAVIWALTAHGRDITMD